MATKSCCKLELNGYMASGSAQENLLVVVVDVSHTFVQSSSAGDSTQRVILTNKHTHTVSDVRCLLVFVLQLPVSQCLDDVVTFLNSFLLLSHDNRVAVCLCHQAGR